MAARPHRIGTLRERSLHAALKRHYREPGDRIEAKLRGFSIDIKRGTALIEIQTGSLGALRRKLAALLDEYPITVVHPVAALKWIVRAEGGGPVRRKSPKRGRVEDAFAELVGLPDLIRHPHFALEVALVETEEHQRDDGAGSRKRKFRSIEDRRLVRVIETRRFAAPGDYLALLPAHLAEPFTNADLALALKRPRWLAEKMSYCLRRMGALDEAGKRGRSLLMRRRIPA